MAIGRIKEDDECRALIWHLAHLPECSRNPAVGTGALAGLLLSYAGLISRAGEHSGSLVAQAELPSRSPDCVSAGVERRDRAQGCSQDQELTHLAAPVLGMENGGPGE